MKKNILLSTLLLTFIFTSCNGNKKVAEVSQQELLSGKYEILSIQETQLYSKLFIEFNAADDKISGKTDCNSYIGGYTLENNKIIFQPITVTKMYCEEHVMKVEHNLFKALKNTATFTLDNNMLTLISENNGGITLKAYKVK